MTATKSKARPRTLKLNKPRPATTQSVQNLLLDLAYNLHATRVIRVLPPVPTTAVQ